MEIAFYNLWKTYQYHSEIEILRIGITRFNKVIYFVFINFQINLYYAET